MSHPSPVARFYVGQIVHHLRFDYRGVVFDVDPTFQGTDDWYEAVARSRPPKDRPWYHVLVDRGQHTTYVAERHLEPDGRCDPIRHPLVGVLCGDYRDGRYLPRGEVQ
ncbi:MAG: heat shock protein HspQ [Acidobacteria bacterium]|nr:heat shock protein HspQ [Acidobacteriota bacterium]